MFIFQEICRLPRCHPVSCGHRCLVAIVYCALREWKRSFCSICNNVTGRCTRSQRVTCRTGKIEGRFLSDGDFRLSIPSFHYQLHSRVWAWAEEADPSREEYLRQHMLRNVSEGQPAKSDPSSWGIVSVVSTLTPKRNWSNGFWSSNLVTEASTSMWIWSTTPRIIWSRVDCDAQKQHIKISKF